MTDFEDMLVPKMEDLGIAHPNQLWAAPQILTNGTTADVERYVLFDETNFLDWNDSRYAVQQTTTRANKRRSSPANLQTEQLRLGYIMQDLNIADSQMDHDMNVSADIMLNPASAAFDPGFIQSMPIKEEYVHPQKCKHCSIRKMNASWLWRLTNCFSQSWIAGALWSAGLLPALVNPILVTLFLLLMLNLHVAIQLQSVVMIGVPTRLMPASISTQLNQSIFMTWLRYHAFWHHPLRRIHPFSQLSTTVWIIISISSL